ncbi:hypothetical protein DSM104443_02556 [Usitatibacter rugosus]|uniref:Uncharacterized protein n=1 Tax=Usitatibacter rugosus TaxID=2732067 RepID=A0A6M4GW63_9PROT|nr:hypothetical protein [Usitatibacter rugosus]QJR11479.1 hypothetical protein DSM104443_02556 [Usitatibacter rugosus]
MSSPFTPPKANLETLPSGVGPAPELWNPDAAGAWSIVLSPIFGSVLVMKNYQALGEADLARTARNWMYGSIFMLFVTAFVGGAAGLVWIVIWYMMFQRKQTHYIRERWGKDYPKRGWLVPLLIGFGALVAAWVAIIAGLGLAAR